MRLKWQNAGFLHGLIESFHEYLLNHRYLKKV